MNFRRFFSTIIISAFLAVSTSCSFLGGVEEKPAPLTIYIMDYDSYTKNAIAKYNELHKDAKIQEKTYFIDQADEMAKDLNSGLASGGGPDIIVTLPAYLPELTKYIENGIFCDLNEMIEKDVKFKLSEYNEKVMESGVYNGKRYFMPLTYSVNLLFSTNDILYKNSINLDEKGVSLKQLSETALKYMTEKSNKDGYFFDSLDFNALVQNSNEKFVDVENMKASLDSPGFIELLKQYKQLYPSILPKDKRPTVYTLDRMSEQLKNGSVIMLSSDFNSPASLWVPYSSFTSDVDPFIMGMPGAEEGRGATPNPGKIAAVNANCKYKKGAFEFIKILLSAELQEGDLINDIPVNKAAYEKKKEALLENRNTGDGFLSGGGGGCEDTVTLKKMFDRLDYIISGMSDFKLYDANIQKILYSELEIYLEGSKNAEDTARDMQRKVTEYLNGGFKPEKDTVLPDSADTAVTGKTLRIYYMGFNLSVKNAIRKYKATYKDVNFDETVFMRTDPDENIDEYKNKLVTSLMAGNGPDIIVADGNVFNSIHKTVSSGIYCDLNEFITGDGEFKLSDYVEEVLNYGVFEGKRYFIPFDYAFWVFISSKNVLEKNNLKLDMTKWSWKYIGDMAKQYRIQNAGEKSYLFDCDFKFSRMIRSSGMKLVDYANKKSAFDCPEFLGLLEAYKDVYPSVCPEDIQEKYSNLEDKFNNGACILFSDISCSDPEGLFGSYNKMQNSLKSELEIYPYPTLDGNKHIYPTPGSTIGINSKCNIKSEAFDFVKILISKDLQSRTDSYNNPNILLGIINKAAYESDKEFYMSDKVKQLIPSGLLPLPVSLADKLDGMTGRLKTGELPDNEVNKMIEEEMPDLLNGKKTAKQTAKAIDEKVNLYLNE